MPETLTRPSADRLDEVLALLASRERRALIRRLQDTPTDTISLDALATALAADSPHEQDAVRSRLHHTHLPKLAGTPLLSYNPATATVEYRGHDGLEPLLNSLQRHETAPEADHVGFSFEH